MPRPFDQQNTHDRAERQARYRAARTPMARRSFASAVRPIGAAGSRRWNDTIAALAEPHRLEYGGWLDALPDNQHDSATAEALRAIVELDLPELLAIEPPRGFGRD